MTGAIGNRIIKCIVLVSILMLAVSSCAYGDTYSEARETGDNAVETPVYQAWIDAEDGIVPCFGITNAQLNSNFNQVINESGSWIANNYVPYQNLKDFALVPSKDTVSTEIMSYFGKDYKTGSYYFVYNLNTGELFESNGNSVYQYAQDGYVLYSLHFSAKESKYNFLQGFVTVYIDGYWIEYETGGYILSSSGELKNIYYGIRMYRNGGNNLYIEYDYSNRSYPDCPFVEMKVYDPDTY